MRQSIINSMNAVTSRLRRDPTILVDTLSGLTSIGWGILLVLGDEMLKLPSYEQLSAKIDMVGLDQNLFGFVMVIMGLIQVITGWVHKIDWSALFHSALQLGAAILWLFIAVMFWTVREAPLSTAIVPYTILAFLAIWAFLEFSRRK